MSVGSKSGCDVSFILNAAYELDPCNIQFNVPRNAEGNVVARKSRIILASEPCNIGGLYFLQMTDSYVVMSSEPCELDQYTAPPIEISDSVIELRSEPVSSEYLVDVNVYPTNSIILVQCIDKAPIEHIIIPRIAPTSSIIIIGCNEDSYPTFKIPEPNDLPTGKAVRTNDINGLIVPWRVAESTRSQFIETLYSMRWAGMKEADTYRDVSYKQKEEGGITRNIVWGGMRSVYFTEDIPWQDLPQKHSSYCDIRWRMLEIHIPDDPESGRSYEYKYNIPWGGFTDINQDLIIPWHAPELKDMEVQIPWGAFPVLDNEYIIPWYNLGGYDPKFVKDIEFIIPWGPMDLTDICCEKYFPPPSCYPIVFNMTEPIVAHVCQGVVLSIGPIYTNSLTKYCPYQHNTSGHRDSLTDPSDLSRLLLKPRDEYDMINVVTVHILNDPTPLPVTSINIDTDKDSYLWSFSLSMAKDNNSKNVIDRIKPGITPSGALVYTDIVIGVNQNYWVCRVDGYSESRSFGKDTWTLTGRSPSMVLGSPQNKKFTYTYSTDYDISIAGQSIIDLILNGSMLQIDNSGWEADFSAYNGSTAQQINSTGFRPQDASDWGFRNGSLSWQDSTQIEAIKSLTDSIGAFIITEPNSIGYGLNTTAGSTEHQKLYIRPRYGHSPWRWSEVWDINNPLHYKRISTELAIEVGRTNECKADYNAVMVMGTMKQAKDPASPSDPDKGFPVVELYKNGVDPDYRIYAPDIVDEKLQTTKACEEAGRPVLCETGIWLKHTLKMYSLRFPDSTDETLPPLCWPGNILKVQEGNSRGGQEHEWFGDVESVQINVAITNNVTYVSQTLGVNEYIA